MKNTLIIAAFIFSIFSCTKADIQSKDENGDCLVTINPVGEISTTDNPLTKVSTSNIYMLQVYQNDTSYAVGLFNDLSLMKVYLRKGELKKAINWRIILNHKRMILLLHYRLLTQNKLIIFPY